MSRRTKILLAVFGPIIALKLAVLYGAIISARYDHAFWIAEKAHDVQGMTEALCGKQRDVWYIGRILSADECRSRP